mgnify:CR=1 FL=1
MSGCAPPRGDLARAVSASEYELVLDHADELGFSTMFWQEGGAVDESFTPAFDTTGVLRAADASMPPIQLAADNAALGFRARFAGIATPAPRNNLPR